MSRKPTGGDDVATWRKTGIMTFERKSSTKKILPTISLSYRTLDADPFMISYKIASFFLVAFWRIAAALNKTQ
jgi:hypothetical protein